MSIHKDVVTLEISMYNWRIMTMQISKTLEDLASPILNCMYIYSPVFLSIPTSSKHAVLASLHIYNVIIIAVYNLKLFQDMVTLYNLILGGLLRIYYSLRVPEVNISVMKLKVLPSTLIQDAWNFMMDS